MIVFIDRMSTSSPSLSNFYTALESGEVLCELVHTLYHDTIDINQVRFFNQSHVDASTNSSTVNRLSQSSSELTKSSDYLFHAKSNVDLFIQALAKLGIECKFTFENLYLQKNKSSILGSLYQLRKLAASSRRKSSSASNTVPLTVSQMVDVDLTSPMKKDKDIQNQITTEPKKRDSVQTKPLETSGNRNSLQKRVQVIPEAKTMNEVVDTSEPSLAFSDGLFQGLIAVYALPFVIVYILIFRLFLRNE
jgi:hypothetical protein